MHTAQKEPGDLGPDEASCRWMQEREGNEKGLRRRTRGPGKASREPVVDATLTYWLQVKKLRPEREYGSLGYVVISRHAQGQAPTS